MAEFESLHNNLQDLYGEQLASFLHKGITFSIWMKNNGPLESPDNIQEEDVQISLLLPNGERVGAMDCNFLPQYNLLYATRADNIGREPTPGGYIIDVGEYNMLDPVYVSGIVRLGIKTLVANNFIWVTPQLEELSSDARHMYTLLESDSEVRTVLSKNRYIVEKIDGPSNIDLVYHLISGNTSA